MPSLGEKKARGAIQVGKWQRFEVSYRNTSYRHNPFDLELYGVFTHIDSGRTLSQFGFYSGENTWKIYFMPDRLGEWRFYTVSPDPALNGKRGVFVCVPSGLPGRLVPERNRWKLEDLAKYEFPIIIPTRQWFKRTSTSYGIDEFIEWSAKTVGARLIGTTLVYFGHAEDEVPYLKGKEGKEFNVAMFDRLNNHFDAMRDAGLGHYLMFYSDDDESPNLRSIYAFSKKELRLFRYAIARFAPYPIVMWDSGIDVGETRNNLWVDWFAHWFRTNDPWDHPVGSRTGGGSGGKHPERATYYSDGSAKRPEHSVFVRIWKNRVVPTAFTDRWREDFGRGNFDQDEIRRAVWEIGLVGGTAVYVGGSENSGYLTENYVEDFRAAADCGHASRFFREEILELGLLCPHEELLISSSEAVLSANPGEEYVAYLPFGGSIGIDFSDTRGLFSYKWYNPRVGKYEGQGSFRGDSSQTFLAKDSNDWVLYICRQN